MVQARSKNPRIYKIEEIRDFLKNYFLKKPVYKAFLFGSYARQEANESSDIDLLLELNYEPGIAMIFAFMKTELEAILDKKIDIITTNSISKHIIENLEKEKILIYEKG
ncbi:MAG: nucleotidyltransferase domain-containing protein [Leptospiraceae bacterium]|nr:nucleotidyltransferase domain-containing protein [Leptospiraceae bacterium]